MNVGMCLIGMCMALYLEGRMYVSMGLHVSECECVYQRVCVCVRERGEMFGGFISITNDRVPGPFPRGDPYPPLPDPRNIPLIPNLFLITTH